MPYRGYIKLVACCQSCSTIWTDAGLHAIICYLHSIAIHNATQWQWLAEQSPALCLTTLQKNILTITKNALNNIGRHWPYEANKLIAFYTFRHHVAVVGSGATHAAVALPPPLTLHSSAHMHRALGDSKDAAILRLITCDSPAPMRCPTGSCGSLETLPFGGVTF